MRAENGGELEGFLGWGLPVDPKVIDDLDRVKSGVVFYKRLPKSLPFDMARNHDLGRNRVYPLKDSKGRFRWVRNVEMAVVPYGGFSPSEAEPTEDDGNTYVVAYTVDLAEKPKEE